MPEIIYMKYGAEEHMKSFLNEGVVFMNSISFFHKKKEDVLRHDKNEGVLSIHRIKNMYTKESKNEKTAPIKYINGVIKVKSKNIDYINIFCMYTVDIEGVNSLPLSKIVDKRIFQGFGDYLVIILNPDEFIRRIKLASEILNIKVISDIVKYKDFDTYEGDVGLFLKDKKYSFQKEIRFVALNNKKLEPLKLKIGPIDDIAILLKSSDTPNILFSID